jgi:predicted amidohydrolase YtcJ
MTLRFSLLLFLLLSACTGNQSHADLILYNGTVYTVDKTFQTEELVAVRKGKIAYVGTRDQLDILRGPATEMIDLKGKTVFPGFIDAHAHMLGIGFNKIWLDMSVFSSYSALTDSLKRLTQNLKPGAWVLGRGWHQDKWTDQAPALVKGFPTNTDLNLLFPDNPVYFRHASGHAVWVNQQAMAVAGINQQTLSPAGGEIIRDQKNRMTGIFNESAELLFSDYLPTGERGYRERAMDIAIEECLRSGLTGLHDAGSDSLDIEIFKSYASSGALPLNLYVMLAGSEPNLLKRFFASGPVLNYGNGSLTIRSVKLYSDGALGSRGALLLDAYADRHNHYGNAVTDIAKMQSISAAANQSGFQVCIHAIGDSANHAVLDIYENLNRELATEKSMRNRIEHAQHLAPDDINRFAELNVIAAMQPIHMASDMPWAIHRLGKQRLKEGAYVWQKLLASGAKIVSGTDAPVEPLDPIANFYAAVARKTLKGQSEDWFFPDQKMTREQALRSMTIDAAYGAFAEATQGSIEKGKDADFTILTRDIVTVPETDILKTEVWMTITDGIVRYRFEKNE